MYKDSTKIKDDNNIMIKNSKNMKTLILFGSPRKNGRTKRMIDLLQNNLEGNVNVIDAYRIKDINPCIDCRYCWTKRGCSIKDGMQEIYKMIDEADNIVIASPVYFHSVTGQLKIIIDRLQVYWSGVLRKDKPKNYIKKGAFLLTGGAPKYKNQFLGTEIVCKSVFDAIVVKCVGEVLFSNTDEDDLEDRPDIEKKIIEISKELNKKIVVCWQTKLSLHNISYILMYKV